MKQGTKSILFGCHSPIHALMVIRAWRILYGAWPRPWQLVCIFLHDVGHWNTNYLDNFEEKEAHWVLGARIAKALFGYKGEQFIAGHCTHSGYPLSALYRADKYSWYISPRWWLVWNCIVEPELNRDMSTADAILLFQNAVRQSIESGEFIETHQIYMDSRSV